MLTDAGRAAEMRVAGRRRARRFTWQGAAEACVSAYRAAGAAGVTPGLNVPPAVETPRAAPGPGCRARHRRPGPGPVAGEPNGAETGAQQAAPARLGAFLADALLIHLGFVLAFWLRYELQASHGGYGGVLRRPVRAPTTWPRRC